MKENIPEKTVERLHLKYDEYKATAEEPIFTFKEFCSKMQYLETLVEEIDYYKKEKSKLLKSQTEFLFRLRCVFMRNQIMKLKVMVYIIKKKYHLLIIYIKSSDKRRK